MIPAGVKDCFRLEFLKGNLLVISTGLGTKVFLANVVLLEEFDTCTGTCVVEFLVLGILGDMHTRTDSAMELTVRLEHKLDCEETTCKKSEFVCCGLMQTDLFLVTLALGIFFVLQIFLVSILCVLFCFSTINPLECLLCPQCGLLSIESDDRLPNSIIPKFLDIESLIWSPLDD